MGIWMIKMRDAFIDKTFGINSFGTEQKKANMVSAHIIGKLFERILYNKHVSIVYRN